MMNSKFLFLSVILLVSFAVLPFPVHSQAIKEDPVLDEKVRKFLADNTHQWYDMNVPSVDGRLLYDIIIKNGYKTALEIGTSTGHSAIWIAWALSKTGGRLITIEIDEGRYRKAIENFKKAGLSDYIDARLADAHQLVKELDGPFDFVFSDADKDWYKNYFIEIDPKLIPGGCFAAHNIRDFYSSGTGSRGQGRGHSGNDVQGTFLAYIKSLPEYETSVNSQGGGVSISYKRKRN